MVGGEVFDGAVAVELAPATAASPRTTTSPSAPAAPITTPASVERFFAERNMDEPPSDGDSLLRSGTHGRARTGALERPFYDLLTKLLPRGCEKARLGRRLALSPRWEQNPAGPDFRAGRPREVGVSKAAKLAGVLGGIAIAAGLLAYYIVGYLVVTPPNVQAAGTAPQVHVTLQTVAALGFGPHPDWVSYLVKN